MWMWERKSEWRSGSNWSNRRSIQNLNNARYMHAWHDPTSFSFQFVLYDPSWRFGPSINTPTSSSNGSSLLFLHVFPRGKRTIFFRDDYLDKRRQFSNNDTNEPPNCETEKESPRKNYFYGVSPVRLTTFHFIICIWTQQLWLAGSGIFRLGCFTIWAQNISAVSHDVYRILVWQNISLKYCLKKTKKNTFALKPWILRNSWYQGELQFYSLKKIF